MTIPPAIRDERSGSPNHNTPVATPIGGISSVKGNS